MGAFFSKHELRSCRVAYHEHLQEGTTATRKEKRKAKEGRIASSSDKGIKSFWSTSFEDLHGFRLNAPEQEPENSNLVVEQYKMFGQLERRDPMRGSCGPLSLNTWSF